MIDKATNYVYNRINSNKVNDYFHTVSLESNTPFVKQNKDDIRKFIVGLFSCFFVLLVLLTVFTTHSVHKFNYKKYIIREEFTNNYGFDNIDPLCETELSDKIVYHLKDQYRFEDIFGNMKQISNDDFYTISAPYIGIDASLVYHQGLRMVNPEIKTENDVWKKKFFLVETPFCEIKQLFSIELSVQYLHLHDDGTLEERTTMFFNEDAVHLYVVINELNGVKFC